MADRYVVSYTDIAVNVTASPGKTIAQILNPSTQRLTVVEFAASFDGVASGNTPVMVRIVRQTTAGTPSGNTTPTPVQDDAGGPASLQTAVVAGAAAWTTEPTVTDVMWQERIHPQSGQSYQFPLGREILIAASGRVALVMWAAQSVNVTGFFRWET